MIDMKLKTQLSVLDPDIVVLISDPNDSDLIVKVKDVPKKLKERTVNKLYGSYIDNKYDLSIFLNW